LKKYIIEIFDPVKDFYSMRHTQKKELVFFIFVPILVAMMFFMIDFVVVTTRSFTLDGFVLDILNQLIIVLSLFISFNMAYLSIIVTSSSKNVDGLKETLSSEYILKNRKDYCTLYQVLISEITYTLFLEIAFLLLIFLEKFLMYICNDIIIKFIIAIDIAFLVHVLLLMLITIKNIYFSFWKSE